MCNLYIGAKVIYFRSCIRFNLYDLDMLYTSGRSDHTFIKQVWELVFEVTGTKRLSRSSPR